MCPETAVKTGVSKKQGGREMRETYIALHLTTTPNRGKAEKTVENMISAGFTEDEAKSFVERRLSKYDIPPVEYQKLVGAYMTVLPGDGARMTNVASFACAGDSESSIVNFVFHVFRSVGATHPIVICGNGGYAMSLLLSRANELTLEKKMGVREKGFLDDMYGGVLAVFHDTSDKFGKNYVNKYSKVIFDPAEFDSCAGIPVEAASERMFAARDWESIMRISRYAGENLFLRAMNIVDNRRGLTTVEIKGEKKTVSAPSLLPQCIFSGLPDPEAAFVFTEGEPSKRVEVAWRGAVGEGPSVEL